MKNHGVRHEIVLVLTPEMIETIRLRIQRKTIAIAAAEFADRNHSREVGVIDLGDLSEPTNITWEFWRMNQSQFRYRPTGVVDLGEIE